MGSSQSQDLSRLAKEIWQWCVERDSWISCAHVSGRWQWSRSALKKVSHRYRVETWYRLITRSSGSAEQPLPLTCLLDGSITGFQNTCLFNLTPTACFIDAFSIDWSSHIVYISAFQSPPKGAEKTPDRQGRGDRGGTPLEKTDVSADAHQYADNDTSTTVSPGLASHSTQRQDTEISPAEQAGHSGMQSIRGRLEAPRLPGDAASIVMSSWRPHIQTKCDSAWENQVYFNFLRKLSFRRTDKYKQKNRMQKTELHYLRQMWFDLHLVSLISAWNSTKSAPLNGHYPKLQFPTYTWCSHAQ